MSLRTLPAATALALAAALALTSPEPQPANAGQRKKAQPREAEEAASAVRLADQNLKVEVWASEPHLANPVAFAFDEKGRCFVVETFRHTQGVPDTRGKPWLDDDIAARTVADRVAMYKKYKFPQYPENSERLRLVWDSDGDGRADKDSVFADGFNRYEDGIAAGVLPRKGDVYFACIPDLYLLRDTKGENKATEKKSLVSGFGIHVQFIGHDLHAAFALDRLDDQRSRGRADHILQLRPIAELRADVARQARAEAVQIGRISRSIDRGIGAAVKRA